MRIIFVSPFFWPEEISTGRYNTFLVEALRNEGAKVSVICSHPFYPDWRVSPFDVGNGDFDVRRGGRKIRYPKSQMLRRAVLEFWFRRFASRSLRAHRIHTDLVIEIFPPNLFALSVRAIYRDVPRIGIVHDLQGVMMHSERSFVRRIAGIFVRKLEASALKSCTSLVFLSQEMLEKARAEYDLHGISCDIAYPFFTLQQSDSDDASYKVPKALRGKHKTLVYSGALGEKQNPEMLLKLLHKFAERRPDFHVFVFSRGPIFEQMKTTYGIAKNTIHFEDLVPENELNGLLKTSTIQIIPQAPGSSAGAFPSKLPNIIRAGVPVFAITDDNSELSRIVDQYSLGKASNTWNLDVLATELDEFAVQMELKSEALADSATDQDLASRFDPISLARQLMKVLRNDTGTSGV